MEGVSFCLSKAFKEGVCFCAVMNDEPLQQKSFFLFLKKRKKERKPIVCVIMTEVEEA